MSETQRNAGAVEVDDFRPFLNQTFTLSNGQHAVEIELVEVKELTAPRSGFPGATRKPFRLWFHGPEGVRFGFGVFTLTHDGFGAIELALNPVRVPGGPTDRDCLEAVFN